jgi:hypothetical protein
MTKSQNIHRTKLISRWKSQGLKLRDGESYNMIYEKVQNTTHCELCNIELKKGNSGDARCMDHNHETGYFRYVLCRNCNGNYDKKLNKNNKLGHKWISIDGRDLYFYFRYKRKGFKSKQSTSLTKLIAYSFINLLKKPC